LFSIKLKAPDVAKIKSKLAKTVEASQRKGSALYNYRLDILNEYKETIVSAMGEVWGADGGSPNADPFLGKNINVDWAPLSDRTIGLKRQQSWSLYIWEATGETKSSVEVDGDLGFAGIRKKDALEKALLVEFGGALSENDTPEWNKRALFTLATQIFRDNREQIKRTIKQKVVETAHQQGWGR